MTKYKARLFFGAVSLLFLLLVLKFSVAQNNNSDAIGVRVVPNPNHYSAARWYESQGFKGSPQALTVDGYEAIRDGRTVYVNASNINTDTRVIYTNIYLISYNQNPATPTVDILGKIIKNWKFNSNLGPGGNPIADVVNPSPTCSIASKRCETDKECGANQKCTPPVGHLNSDTPSGLCTLTTPKNCSVDTDCPTNFFCNNLKSKVIRDIKRIGKLEEIKETLYRFKKANNRFPALSAGSYLPNNTISTWPSWNDNLLSDLAAPQTLKDPINRLGDCLGYDQYTCWNAATKRYKSDVTPGTLPTLPAGSYAMAYQSNPTGSEYLLCATLETRNNSILTNNYTFYPNDPTDDSCPIGVMVNPPANQAPILISQSLTGEYNQEFNGSIEVFDYDGDPLTWTLNTAGENWTNWSAVPVLVDTANSNIKNVYATKAGFPRVYNSTLNVSDGRGGVLQVATPITISITPPTLEANDYTFTLDPTIPFNYSFYFTTKNPRTPLNSSYLITLIEGSPDLLNSGGLNKTVTSAGVNRYQVNFFGLIPPSPTNQFPNDINLKYTISVFDNLNNSFTKIVNIHIISPKPTISLNCLNYARSNSNYGYSCFIGYDKQGNYNINYTKVIPTVPDELSIVPCGGCTDGKVYLEGVFNQWINNVTYFPKIKATSDYGAFSSSSFMLLVTPNFCGNGTKESPNSEYHGGLSNNGYESCDGNAGITLDPTLSGPSLQYGCTTGVGVATPYPITTNDQCIFKPIDNNGGYCGDGLCQLKINTGTSTPNYVFVENNNNCSVDCSDCSSVTDSEGQVYGAVQIGDQCWMAENINVGTMLSSASVEPSNSNVIEKWCYNSDSVKCTEHGGLYNWSEAMQGATDEGSQGICPAGWHLPTDAEFNILENKVIEIINSPEPQYVCDLSTYDWKRCADNNGASPNGPHGAGKSLKAIGVGTGNGIGDNLVNFSGKLSGYRFGNPGLYSGFGLVSYFWTSTPGSPSKALLRGVDAPNSSVGRLDYPQIYGQSVRCIRDGVCGPNGCVPGCNCDNKECGDDGCGNSCGTCSGNTECINNQCISSCGNNICNPGDGENCDNCPDCACSTGSTCYNNSCCTPNCAGNTCGSDGCGGTCVCDTGYKCNNNTCEPLTGCGFGGCDQSLGENCWNCENDCPCPGGTVCTKNGTCVVSSCGVNGCEQSLGENCLTCPADCGCVAPKVCKENGICCETDCHGCVQNLSASNWAYCGGSCCNPTTQKCCNTGYVSSCIGINEVCVTNRP